MSAYGGEKRKRVPNTAGYRTDFNAVESRSEIGDESRASLRRPQQFHRNRGTIQGARCILLVERLFFSFLHGIWEQAARYNGVGW